MLKLKNINNIFDIQCTLGEVYEDKHIRLKNDNMYISKDFAGFLIGGEFKEIPQYRSNFYRTKYHIDTNSCYVGIHIREYRTINGIEYCLAGSSGSFGFGGLQHTKNEYLGVRIKRKVNKHIIDIYINSFFIRYEKIRKLQLKIKNYDNTI
jgi:hypothetical protein